MKKFLSYIVIFLCPVFLLAQNLDKNLLESLEKTGREDLINRLDSVKEKYPNSPIPIYLEAYLEQDADKAVSMYRNVAQKFSGSPYAAIARLKIAKYYYAKGSYISARQELDLIKDRFSKSELIPEVKFLAARCLMATGNYSIAEDEFKNIIINHPHSSFKADAREELKLIIQKFKQTGTAPQSNRRVEKITEFPADEVNTGTFTIQIGAYGEQRNAITQKDFYSNKGYNVTISTKYSNNRLLYLVWIGDFATRDEAVLFGDEFKIKNGIHYQVVPK